MINYFSSLVERFVAQWTCGQCAKMHRRAQAAESEAIAVPRRFEGTMRCMARRMYTQRALRFAWKERYRTVVRLLEERGMDREAIRQAVFADEDRRKGRASTEAKP